MKLKIVPENLLERVALRLNLAPTPLVDTQVAFNSARAIMAASALGIFEALGKNSRSHLEIASACGTDTEATRQLLDCLVGIGYVSWNNGKYSMRPKYYKWLLKEYESNLAGKLRFQFSEWNWMNHLEEFVRTGKPLDLHSALQGEEWEAYQEGMRDLSINAARELAKKLKLPGSPTRMLDIGGSHGLFSIEICRKFAGLSSTILELPGAVAPAKRIAARHGLTDRVSYREGNALTDELGKEEFDLVLINNVVHHFTVEQNRELAKKVARALKPGGMYAVGEFIRRNKPGEGGAVAATSGLYFALISSSGTWSKEEITEWQRAAGLRPQKPISLMTLPGWKLLPANR